MKYLLIILMSLNISLAESKVTILEKGTIAIITVMQEDKVYMKTVNIAELEEFKRVCEEQNVTYSVSVK